MDKQQVLDRVIALMHAQGAPGQQNNGCFYRTCDDRKSAIGFLIPDELYSDDLEDCDPSQLPQYILEAVGADSDDEVEFIVAVEAAHDMAARKSRSEGSNFWSEWETALERVADTYSLSLVILKTLGPVKVSETVIKPPVGVARLASPR